MGRRQGIMKRNKGGTAPKDFVKVKNKVGKKKKETSNVTNTDFAVRQVHLLAQPALLEKGEQVTHRKLGLWELLAHMQHHSAKVRRDALRGLQELCSEHDGVLGKNLARILEATTVGAIDANVDVREAFRTFQTWLLQALPRETLAAFAATLALQVRSALSHVSGDVRGDGLTLLELYVDRLGEARVLSQVETLRVVKILCQMQSHSETVLSCLFRLLQPRRSTEASSAPAAAGAGGTGPPQTALQVVLDRAMEAEESGVEHDGADSPVWAFCLRTWMQAGEVPKRVSSQKPTRATSQPATLKMRCAAVLELAMRGALLGQSAGGIPLRPSVGQVASLAGLVRRGDWPLRTEGALRQQVDSANLYMARVCALLAAGGAHPETSEYNLALLVDVVLALLEDLKPSVSTPGTFLGGGELKPLGGMGATACALQILDLLWSCCAHASTGASRGLVLGHDARGRLAAATAALAEASVAKDSPAILAVPLAASLIGLQPTSLLQGAPPPAALRNAWPEALANAGEPCLAHLLEAKQPGSAALWVETWPKLLFHLGGNDPELSGFLLQLLLALAKLAARPAGIHSELFAQTRPLLVPFLTGPPGEQLGEAEPPPLARLPPGLQRLAALLLSHFPRMNAALLSLLARLVCRWSDIGTAGDAVGESEPPCLGTETCELLLEAMLGSLGGQATDLLPLRLEAALTVLSAQPRGQPSSTARAVSAELTALRLADAVASWLLGAVSMGLELQRVAELSYDDRQRLAFQALAWPLCAKLLAVRTLAPRALCFLFICAAKLPRDGVQPGAASLAWCDFLRGVFAELFLRGGSCPTSADAGLAGALAATPLCDPTRSGGLPMVAGLGAERHLARMFVATCMACTATPDRTPAYELLAKLCVEHLTVMCSQIAEAPAGHEEEPSSSLAGCVLVLSEAIAYRNEHVLSTDGWGRGAIGTFADASLAQCNSEALRGRLREGLLPRLRLLVPSVVGTLESMLPLL